MVDIGSEKRQVVSGIAGFYTPEELVGRDVVVIANLAPAVLFGVESRGMILAAGEEASLLVPFRHVEPGTKDPVEESGPGGIRTPDVRVRSPALYPG